MKAYLVRRLVQIVPTVLMITFVVFVMMRSIPGDAVVALPVLHDTLVRLPVTFELIVLAMTVALVIAIPASIIGALRRNT